MGILMNVVPVIKPYSPLPLPCGLCGGPFYRHRLIESPGHNRSILLGHSCPLSSGLSSLDALRKACPACQGLLLVAPKIFSLSQASKTGCNCWRWCLCLSYRDVCLILNGFISSSGFGDRLCTYARHSLPFLRSKVLSLLSGYGDSS